MTYEATLKFIHSLNRFGIKPGQERIALLMKELGNPQDRLKFIHIAGTNGKGSTCAALSNIMIAAGKKTGLFISPFVTDFRERIQINGEYIEKKSLCSLTEKVKNASFKVENITNDNVTEFEFITAVAFLYFAENNCDIVVLEVGLGGRLDSTNIIKTPLVTVITKIDLDHTAVLGDTVEEIALEKCGIIKKGAVTVTPSTQNEKALSVIKKTVTQKGAFLKVALRKSVSNIKAEAFGTSFTYKGIDIKTKMPGLHQVENMSVAAETALSLGVDPKYISAGIYKTVFPARLEVISKKPLVLLDGAHNDNGADALAEYLDSNFLRPVTVLGMMKDKDCRGVLSKIASRAVCVITVTVVSNQRAESGKNLAEMAENYCSNVLAAESYDDALRLAKEKAEETFSPLLVCGSLYLASDIRQKLTEIYEN